MSRLILLSKPGCHLCEVMKATAVPLLEELGLELVVRDVRDDPADRRRYATEIPVLLWDGVVVAQGRATGAALRARLVELARSPLRNGV